MKRIIRLPAVEAKTGLKHSEIYQRIKDGQFPAKFHSARRQWAGWSTRSTVD